MGARLLKITVAFEGSGQNVTTTPKFRMYASYRSKCMVPANEIALEGRLKIGCCRCYTEMILL